MKYRYTKVDIILNDDEKQVLKTLLFGIQTINGKTGKFELTIEEKQLVKELLNIL